MWVEAELQNGMKKKPLCETKQRPTLHPKTKLETLRKELPEIPEN